LQKFENSAENTHFLNEKCSFFIGKCNFSLPIQLKNALFESKTQFFIGKCSFSLPKTAKKVIV